MKRTLYCLALLLVTLPLAALDIVKLSEVKTGMTGEGRTIFKGTRTETFRFKVLGVLEKFAPGKNLIIVELDNPALNDGGIISGMSGSPVYVDGRLLGSVSYGFAYSKKPIAGVTPIEDILKTAEFASPNYSVEISNIKMDVSRESLKGIADLLRRELVRRMSATPAPGLEPIRLLASTRGITPEAASFLAPVFAPMGAGQVVGELGKKSPAADLLTPLAAADAVSIPLVRGDFEYSASGTVTCVDGQKAYIFGHPFFNVGTVEFPLHKAEVITVVPSFESPFKMVSTRQQVGMVVQDRYSGVLAELGKAPKMIPMKVFVKNRGRNFNLEMINHPLLTPSLTYVALSNIFQTEFQQFGFQAVGVNCRIFIEGEENVVIDDFYSGTTAYDDFANLMMAVNYFLLNNRERTVRIQKINVELNGMETMRRTELENVLINKASFLPGEPMELELQMQNDRGQAASDKITLKAPNLPPGTEFYLMAADAQEMVDFDTKVIKTAYFPAQLAPLIRALNNLRRSNRIYFKLYMPTEGFFLRGYEYANPPKSMANVFVYGAQSRDQSEMLVSTITEYQYEVPAAVSGKKVFRLKIKERKNES